MRQLEKRKEKKDMKSKDKKEGDFVGEKLSTLACPTSAYAYCCLQVWAFPTGIAGGKMSDVS